MRITFITGAAAETLVPLTNPKKKKRSHSMHPSPPMPSFNQGYIFMCNDASEASVLRTRTGAASPMRRNQVFRLRRGDAVFVYNYAKRRLVGPFAASGLAYMSAEGDADFPVRMAFQETAPVYALRVTHALDEVLVFTTTVPGRIEFELFLSGDTATALAAALAQDGALFRPPAHSFPSAAPLLSAQPDEKPAVSPNPFSAAAFAAALAQDGALFRPPAHSFPAMAPLLSALPDEKPAVTPAATRAATRECCVCLDELPLARMPILNGCGHQRMCAPCANDVEECPLCRTPFDKLLRPDVY